MAYGVVVSMFPGKPHYVFFIAAFTDLILYEVRMTKLWPALLLIAGLLPGCAAPPGPSTTAPASQAAATGVVYWQYVRSTSYEARQPGLGISHRYESRVGWVDVYVYDLKQGNWLPGVDDPRFDEHFSATVNEVRLAGASGIYAKVEVGRVSDVRIEEQTLRRVSFRVLHAASGKSYESLTFLTARNGRLLKYRMAPPGTLCGTKRTWQSCSEATSLSSQLTRYSPLGSSVVRAAVMNSQRLPQPSVSLAITTSLKRSKRNSLPNSSRKPGLRGSGGSPGCSRSYSSSLAGRSRRQTCARTMPATEHSSVIANAAYPSW